MIPSIVAQQKTYLYCLMLTFFSNMHIPISYWLERKRKSFITPVYASLCINSLNRWPLTTTTTISKNNLPPPLESYIRSSENIIHDRIHGHKQLGNAKTNKKSTLMTTEVTPLSTQKYVPDLRAYCSENFLIISTDLSVGSTEGMKNKSSNQWN